MRDPSSLVLGTRVWTDTRRDWLHVRTKGFLSLRRLLLPSVSID
ncbi:LOW QUALITY PROTEIN: hypothetical protein TorRG33x02_259960 [Trema orientale]|uniref:Uncharacterized protein n=1 Tax=Trema orientale TaxID=63057 RepID=A0A2P5D793_TREOI|nr:LOW QUALITY PROTEIN: hypothetical protein TorRG33x02_259960 [Trema orientale]